MSLYQTQILDDVEEEERPDLAKLQAKEDAQSLRFKNDKIEEKVLRGNKTESFCFD